MFKTRLRCAFNKAPDIEEETDMRKYKGPSPYRVYRLLPCGEFIHYRVKYKGASLHIECIYCGEIVYSLLVS